MALSKILSDLLEQDKIAKFTKTGNATATLGSLTLSTAVSGAGGLDTGTIAASTFYYVYTVVSSNAVKLVASTSAISPTGFTQYKKVGAFYTDSSSNIFKAYFFGEVNLTVLSAKVSITGAVSDENVDFINGPFTVAAGLFTGAFSTGLFTVTPNCVVTTQNTSTLQSDAIVYSSSPTQLVVQSIARGTGAVTSIAYPFNIVCQKTGVDATMPDWSRI